MEMEPLHPVGNQILFENDYVRVWRIDVAAGETLPMHHHLLPYVLVHLRDSVLSVGTPDGEPIERPVQAGVAEWRDSGELHMFVNLGSDRYQNVLVEVKGADGSATPVT